MTMDAVLLEAMKNVDIRTVDPKTLMDVRDVVVNLSLPQGERDRDYIRQIGNPYCYKCGKLIIKSVFPETEVTITDRFESLFYRL